MSQRSIQGLLVAFCTLGLAGACEEKKEQSKAEPKAEQALSATPTPAPEPEPEPEPTASAEPEKVEVPKWVDEYADALCKRVAVCRGKLLAKVPAQQKMMLSMQIPTQEACLENTRRFEKSPKAELDASEKKALDECLRSVPGTACGNVQTGKVPECQAVVDLLAPYRGDEPAGGAGSE